MADEYKSLKVEIDNGVALVTLMGPGKGNAMGPDFWRELPELFTDFHTNDDVRAIVITGNGGHFSYGLDLMATMTDLGPRITGENLAESRTQLCDLIVRYQAAINKVDECRKPVIAAVSGWCIGGGLDLIAACDIRLASADAKISLRETKIAIVADVGSLQRLPGIIGEGHTRELALTGKDIDAARAKEIGLVNDVYDDPDAVLAAARELAQQIADESPVTVQGVKQVLNYGRDKSIEDGLRYVAVWNSAFLQSNDLGEAVAAFMERRKPDYSKNRK